MIQKRFVNVFASVVGITLLGALLMRATIPAPSGVIYACYIRVIDNAVTNCSARTKYN